MTGTCECCGLPLGAGGGYQTITDERGTYYEWVAPCACRRCEQCGRPCGHETFCSTRCANDHAIETEEEHHG